MTNSTEYGPPGRVSAPRDDGDGALRKARRFLSVVTILFWKSLARSIVFSAFAGMALASLGLALPTLRFFETSTYAYADFSHEVDYLLTEEAERVLVGVSRTDSYVSFTRFSNVTFSARGRTNDRVEMLLTARPDRIGLSWFSERLAVAQRHVSGEKWIDLSAHLADALGVAPGDVVDISIGAVVYRPTVRRVLAVRYGDSEYVSVGPMPPPAEMGFASEADRLPTVATLTSERSAEDIQALLAGFPKGDSALVSPTARLRAATDARATFGYRVIFAISLVAYLTVAALAVREATALVARNSRSMSLLQVIGVRRGRLVRAILMAETLAFSMGAVAGCYFCVEVIYDGVLFPALPPGYELGVAGAVVLGTVLFGLVAWATLARKTWRWSTRSPFPTDLS